MAAENHQVEDVLLEAAATKAGAGLEELGAQARIAADGAGDLLHVGAGGLRRAAMLLIELMRWLPIRRDSARSHQWVAPAERVEATEATILLNQRVPHELQPCQRSGLSRCALPARPSSRLGR